MIIPIADVSKWDKPLHIASKISVDLDDDGNEIPKYDKPEYFEFNYRAISSDAEMAEFGEKASITKRMTVPIEYKYKFKEYDVAYLDGVTPNGEKTMVIMPIIIYCLLE